MEMTYHIFIYGRVQGVGFRFFALKEALEEGVRGWVRNNYDGSVEMVVQGLDAKLDAFVDRIERGNDLSIVECIDIREYEGSQEFESFEIKY